MTFMDRLNAPKFDFTKNWSGGKIIKPQQSQASTSHFQSFWSIVVCKISPFSLAQIKNDKNERNVLLSFLIGMKFEKPNCVSEAIICRMNCKQTAARITNNEKYQDSLRFFGIKLEQNYSIVNQFFVNLKYAHFLPFFSVCLQFVNHTTDFITVMGFFDKM